MYCSEIFDFSHFFLRRYLYNPIKPYVIQHPLHSLPIQSKQLYLQKHSTEVDMYYHYFLNCLPVCEDKGGFSTNAKSFLLPLYKQITMNYE